VAASVYVCVCCVYDWDLKVSTGARWTPGSQVSRHKRYLRASDGDSHPLPVCTGKPVAHHIAPTLPMYQYLACGVATACVQSCSKDDGRRRTLTARGRLENGGRTSGQRPRIVRTDDKVWLVCGGERREREREENMRSDEGHHATRPRRHEPSNIACVSYAPVLCITHLCCAACIVLHLDKGTRPSVRLAHGCQCTMIDDSTMVMENDMLELMWHSHCLLEGRSTRLLIVTRGPGDSKLIIGPATRMNEGKERCDRQGRGKARKAQS